MCGELRELHDRIDATTVYITHDQLEAMAMADRIAIMNQAASSKSERRKKSTIVQHDVRADFIGAPPMSFIDIQTSLRRGDRRIEIDGASVEMPELFEIAPRQVCARRAAGECSFAMPRRCEVA